MNPSDPSAACHLPERITTVNLATALPKAFPSRRSLRFRGRWISRKMLALFRERRKRSFSLNRPRKLAILQGERPLPTSLTAASCLLGHLPLNRQLRCLGKALANAASAIPVPCSLVSPTNQKLYHLPLAPQGSTPPAVTGRTTSSALTLPPRLRATVMVSRLFSTAG